MDKNQHTCVICQKTFIENALFPINLFQDYFIKFIQKQHPKCTAGDFICSKDVKSYRLSYIQESYTDENPMISQLEKDVLKNFKTRKLITINNNHKDLQARTLGEKWADKIAEFGGSWTFIIIFFTALILWIALNSWIFLIKPFDVYPYILLNLILSCLAAIQAPIIMMSQNRQETKDRIRAGKDYQVNLRAALEIHHLTNCVEDLANTQMQHFKKSYQAHHQIIAAIKSMKN